MATNRPVAAYDSTSEGVPELGAARIPERAAPFDSGHALSAAFRVGSTSDRIALQEYELRGWIQRMRENKRAYIYVVDELERAIEAAIKAGLVLQEGDVVHRV